MSEFKYACPVCGQHIKCDTSQSGTVMDCPTCFQKIVAPQAPDNPDPKFILTGQKYSEKKIPSALANAGNASTTLPDNHFPLVVFIIIFMVLAAGAGVFIFRGKIFSSAQSPAASPTHAKAHAKPELVAPPASDTNWTLSLEDVTIPNGPVIGRIHGQDFICDRATFQNGWLMLRAGTHGPMELGVMIDFSGATPEAMAGKTINITTNVEQAAKVTLHWREDDKSSKVRFDDGYALLLEFGKLAKDRLHGKIYLCTPDDEKSYLMGNFNADARKPKPKTPKQ